MAEFYTADEHHGHLRVMLEYENRPFGSLEEMTNEIIRRHNSIVTRVDRVFHLGDFSFFGRERTSEILSRMNGNNYLIKGNHDRGRSTSWWISCGFKEVYSYPIILHGNIIASHEPVDMVGDEKYFNIHGHLHSKKYHPIRQLNVGVDVHDFYPIPYEYIREEMKK